MPTADLLPQPDAGMTAIHGMISTVTPLSVRTISACSLTCLPAESPSFRSCPAERSRYRNADNAPPGAASW